MKSDALIGLNEVGALYCVRNVAVRFLTLVLMFSGLAV